MPLIYESYIESLSSKLQEMPSLLTLYFDVMVPVQFYLMMPHYPRLVIIFSFLLFPILAWSQVGNSKEN